MLYVCDKYRIYKCDTFNYTYDFFDEVDITKGKAKAKGYTENYLKWKPSNKYFKTLYQAIEHIKQVLISNVILNDDLTLSDLINKLDEVSEKLASQEIKIEYIITKYDAKFKTKDQEDV